MSLAVFGVAWLAECDRRAWVNQSKFGPEERHRERTTANLSGVASARRRCHRARPGPTWTALVEVLPVIQRDVIDGPDICGNGHAVAASDRRLGR